MSFQATPSERFDPEDDDNEQEDEDIDCDITKICNTLNINVKRSYADVYHWLDRKVFEDTARESASPRRWVRSAAQSCDYAVFIYTSR